MKKNASVGRIAIRPTNSQPLGERLFKPLLSGNQFQSKSGLKSRSPGTSRTPGVSACLLLATLLTASSVMAFGPPRIIGELRGEPDSSAFGNQFCWVGDQNDDGFDDLLVSHTRALKLFFGASMFENDSLLHFDGMHRSEYYLRMEFIGALTASNDRWFAIGSSITENGVGYRRINLFKGGDELDTMPDVSMTFPMDSFFVVSKNSEMSRPSDYNGDGYHDILCAVTGDVQDMSGYLSIIFGGLDFDTIPDWFVTYPPPRLNTNGFDWASGGDINNDGYDDFILKDQGNIEFYLGGEPMDTSAFFCVTTDIFEPRRLVEFAILPDVNGDGYDDWGFYYAGSDGRVDYDGYYLFYGSEEPDFEPDVTLAGNHLISSFLGQITGGDYNNDGYGDIVTTNPASYFGEGELHVHFGGEDIRSDPDIRISIAETYGEQYTGLGTLLGATGDYNGDGFQDFISSYNSSFVGGVLYHRLCNLTRGENWVSVVNPTPTLPATPFLIDTFPNPFNNSTTISIKNPGRGDYSIHLFDLNGRTLIEDSFKSSGEETIHRVIDASRFAAGLYLVRCVNKSNGISASQKAVLLR